MRTSPSDVPPRRPPPRLGPPPFLLLVLAAVAGVLLLILFGLAPEGERLTRLADAGARTRGAVRTVSRAAVGPPVVFEVAVDYRVGSRAFRLVERRKRFRAPLDRLRPGDSVTVLYRRDEPADAAVSPLPEEVCQAPPAHANCTP